MKIEKTGPVAFLVTTDIVRADGKETHQQFTRTYDGKEHPTRKGATEPAPRLIRLLVTS